MPHSEPQLEVMGGRRLPLGGINGYCGVRGKQGRKKDKFQGVIVETTGLADPAPVAQTFFIDDDVRKHYVLDAVVTVVDAKHLVMRLDDEKPEGECLII